jgi:aryl-alcohol dehydrogenase-like predicted oxidoreductase
VFGQRRAAGGGEELPPTDLQIEYSLLSRGIEEEILPVCRELGVGVTADDVVGIERAVPAGSAAGSRYAAAQMAQLDSER